MFVVEWVLVSGVILGEFRCVLCGFYIFRGILIFSIGIRARGVLVYYSRMMELGKRRYTGSRVVFSR